MGVKWPKKGAKWRLLREHATLLFMTQVLYCHAVALIVVEKSAERQIATTIYSLRTCVENMVSQIFKKALKCSISRMQSGRKSRSLPEGRSQPWPGRKPTQRPAWPAGDQAGFNCRIFAGEKSGVAGVELATASEAPARQPADLGASPFRRRPQPPLSCDLRFNHARFPCRRCQEAGPVRSGRSLLAHDIIGSLRGRNDRSAMRLAAAASWPIRQT